MNWREFKYGVKLVAGTLFLLIFAPIYDAYERWEYRRSRRKE